MDETGASEKMKNGLGLGGKRSHRKKSISLKTVGLFAGIGGLELGLERAGHRTVLLCEKDDSALAVLRESFLRRRRRRVRVVEDVRHLRSGSIPKNVTLIAAGFPCQDLSQAGNTAGIAGPNSGLVRELVRILRGLKKSRRDLPWVLIENVPFMLYLHRGRAIEEIVDALEALEYKWAYRVVDTMAFGIPQRRRRVYILACIDDDPRRVLLADDVGEPSQNGSNGHRSFGFYWTEGNNGLGWARDAIPPLKGGSGVGVPSPPAIWLRNGSIETPDVRDAERLQGFPSGWTKPGGTPDRAGVRWKLLGNAVSVCVAAWIGRRLARPGECSDITGTRLERRDAWPLAAWNVGEGRFGANVSTWPTALELTPIDLFLRRHGKPLSARATAGFLKRFTASSLRSPHPGFAKALAAHFRKMTRNQN